jgi:hypothetical protein
VRWQKWQKCGNCECDDKIYVKHLTNSKCTLQQRPESEHFLLCPMVLASCLSPTVSLLPLSLFNLFPFASCPPTVSLQTLPFCLLSLPLDRFFSPLISCLLGDMKPLMTSNVDTSWAADISLTLASHNNAMPLAFCLLPSSLSPNSSFSVSSGQALERFSVATCNSLLVNFLFVS